MSSIHQISRMHLLKRAKPPIDLYRGFAILGRYNFNSSFSTLSSRWGKEVKQTPSLYSEFTNQKKLNINIGHYDKEYVRYIDNFGKKGLNNSLSTSFFSTKDNSSEVKEEESWMEFMNLVEDNLKEKKSSSKKSFEKKSQRRSLDDRAKAKLKALREAKSIAEDARHVYQIDNGDSNQEALLRQEWIEKEIVVLRAYSQAIKYVGRAREAHAAERLLKEMIERMGVPQSTIQDLKHPLKKKIISRIIDTTAPPSTVDGSENGQKLPSLVSPGPNLNVTRRDFHNVLHSWASSKARKKGEHAEFLLMRMAELSWWYPTIFDTRPDSQSFALAVKCFAGSTHNESLEKILNLHSIHDGFVQRQIPGFVKDEPFFLMHSLKSLKNYNKSEESDLAKDWLTRLHSFVMDSKNQHYNNTNSISNPDESESELKKSESLKSKKLDLTGTYTAIIRSYAKLRGQKGAAENARSVLDMMHQIIELSAHSSTRNDAVAEIEIKSNAYNLVLGSYGDSKGPEFTPKALDLFEKMFSSWSKRNDSNSTTQNLIPYPTEHSFEYCFKSIRNLNNHNDIKKECMKLLDSLEEIYQSDDLHFDVTTRAFNACIELYTNSLSNDPDLLSCIDAILERMRKLTSRQPSVKPDVQTYSLILKACSLGGSDSSADKDVWERAERTFQQLENAEKASSGPGSKVNKWKMTDTCYFYMMKNVINFVDDKEERDELISQLFSQACGKGLVRANILRLFKSFVSDEVYSKKVGSGRLADKWVANVTSSKANYSDITRGGKDKNARRKGKSTSSWLKKQRQRNRHKVTR